MKIGILSRNRALYSTRRLAQAARLRGHAALIIDTLQVAVEIGDGGARWRQATTPSSGSLPQVDGIIPRIGASITSYGLAVVRQFESLNVPTTASSMAIAQSRDKLQSLQLMNRAGLPIPRTVVAGRLSDIRPAVQLVGGLPVIVKLLRGTQGQGVILAANIPTIEAILQALRRLREQMLIQEYIEEAQGRDTRIIVVEHRPVAAMERRAAAGEFRSNLHRGGTAAPVTPDPTSRQLALRAARVHGLGVAGVDIIHSQRGPLVLEVNSSPGLEGIEQTTHKDVAGEVVRYLERLANRKKGRLPPPRRGRVGKGD